jgi:hypothetical protein
MYNGADMGIPDDVKNVVRKAQQAVRTYFKQVELLTIHWRKQLIIAALATVIIVAVIIGMVVMSVNTTPSTTYTPPNNPTSQSGRDVHHNKSTPSSSAANSAAAAQSGSSTATAAGSSATTSTIYPSSVLNLTNWKLTLPVDTSSSGSPDEIDQPALASFNDPPYFYVNSARNGVIFQAPVGGATTSGSNYARSELREMTNNGSQEASWSSTSGTSTMTIREAITHLPVVRPEVVAGQVHGPSDYVMLVRLNGSELFVEDNGKNVGTLDSNYALGSAFTVQITASNGNIQVSYNGVQKANFASSGSGYYFKAGCYTQSNPSDGDSPSAYGQVVIYGLQVSHT